jgi:hypothetical protein
MVIFLGIIIKNFQKHLKIYLFVFLGNRDKRKKGQTLAKPVEPASSSLTHHHTGPTRQALLLPRAATATCARHSLANPDPGRVGLSVVEL